MKRRDHESGPHDFKRNWLSFNEQRPLRTSLVPKFLAAILIMLAACLLLVALRDMR